MGERPLPFVYSKPVFSFFLLFFALNTLDKRRHLKIKDIIYGNSRPALNMLRNVDKLAEISTGLCVREYVIIFTCYSVCFKHLNQGNFSNCQL